MHWTYLFYNPAWLVSTAVLALVVRLQSRWRWNPRACPVQLKGKTAIVTGANTGRFKSTTAPSPPVCVCVCAPSHGSEPLTSVSDFNFQLCLNYALTGLIWKLGNQSCSIDFPVCSLQHLTAIGRTELVHLLTACSTARHRVYISSYVPVLGSATCAEGNRRAC